MPARGGGDLGAAEHAGDFLHPRAAFERVHARDDAGAPGRLGDGELVVRLRRHLGQVRHAKNLAVFPEPAHQRAHHLGHGAADAGVGLVEDQRGHRVGLRGEHRDREPDARELAARGHLRERPRGGPGVRGHPEFHPVDAARRRLGALELYGELAARHAQLGEQRAHARGEAARGGAAPRRQCGGRVVVGRAQRGEPLAKAIDVARGLQALEPLAHLRERGRNVLRREPQLARRVEDRRDARLHLLQPLGVEVHPLGVAGELRRGLVDLDRRRLEQLHRFAQRRVDAHHRAQAVQDLVQPRADRVFALGERFHRRARRLDQRRGVRELLLLGLERGPLALGHAQHRELAHLPLQPLAFEVERARVALGFLEVARRGAPGLERRGHRGQRLRVAAMRVEQLALPAGAQKRLRRVLAVHVEQALADLAQQRGGGRLAVDQRARPAVGVDHPPQQHRARVAGEVALGEPGVEFGRAGELGADVGALRALAHHRHVAARAGGERERVEQDRLARARLAREHGEPRAERDVERVDDHEVAQSQGLQHGAPLRGVRGWAVRAS